MIIIKAMQYCFWLIIIPSIIGKVLLHKKEKSYMYSWILGNILQMGIFFLISIPLILLEKSFTTLLYTYSLILIAIVIICLILKIKNLKKENTKINFKNYIENNIKDFLKNISIFKVIAVIFIIIQLLVKIKYANINNDDSSFVSLSTTMIETNSMYLHDDNGAEVGKLISRRALAPISAYYSVLSQLLDTHVTILTHTVMPIVFLIMAYGVYYYFGKKLFDNEDSRYIFLIMLCLLNLYAFDIKGYNRYLLLYTWFGRSVLAGIILPFIWSISLDAMNKEKNKLLDWITLFVLVLAGCLCSQMAVPLITISIAILSFVSTIRDKKISYLFKSFITIIPCLVVGIIYIMIQ